METDILVFKFLHGSWKFLERVVPNKRTAQTILVLLLQDGHLRTLPPETEHPHRWSRFGQQELHTKASQTYLGGMPTKDSLHGLNPQISVKVLPSKRPRLSRKIGIHSVLLLRCETKRHRFQVDSCLKSLTGKLFSGMGASKPGLLLVRSSL